MKIGLICSDPFYFPGGIQEHVKGLYNFLKSKGYEVKIIAPRYKKSENYGKDFILLGNAKTFSANASKGTLSYCLKKSELENLLKKENFDILHFHNLSFFLGLQLLNLSNSINIITVHASLEGSNVYRFSADSFRFWIRKKLVNKFNGAILIADYLRNYLPKGYNKPISVIPNGIDLSRFKPTNKKIRKFLDGKVNILFVGRIDKRKGLPYLIKAFDLIKKKYENTRLIVVGSGYYKGKCQRIVRRKKIDDVIFVGYISDKDLPKYYATADIFCSPATYGESFGIVLIEAMASGKPVIAFANEGYKRVLVGKGKRFLVKPKDINGLVRKLEILIKDEKLRKEMGRWGVEEVKKYSWDNIGKQIEEFYIRVLNEKA